MCRGALTVALHGVAWNLKPPRIPSAKTARSWCGVAGRGRVVGPSAAASGADRTASRCGCHGSTRNKGLERGGAPSASDCSALALASVRCFARCARSDGHVAAESSEKFCFIREVAIRDVGQRRRPPRIVEVAARPAGDPSRRRARGQLRGERAGESMQGRANVNRAPPCMACSTQMRPPCASTMPFVM